MIPPRLFDSCAKKKLTRRLTFTFAQLRRHLAERFTALRLRDGASYALMANTLSPEFTPDRVKIGAGPDWLKRFANSAPWATPKALRELIGPNWMPQ
jgi:hypothetical protein